MRRGRLSGRETVGHLRTLVLVASLVTATACHSWVSLPVVAGKLSRAGDLHYVAQVRIDATQHIVTASRDRRRR